MKRREIIFVNMMIDIGGKMVSNGGESARAKELSLSLEIVNASSKFSKRSLKVKKLFVEIGSGEIGRSDGKAKEADTISNLWVITSMGRKIG